MSQRKTERKDKEVSSWTRHLSNFKVEKFAIFLTEKKSWSPVSQKVTGLSKY